MALSAEVSAFRPRTVGRRGGAGAGPGSGLTLRQGGDGGALRIARPLPQLGYSLRLRGPCPDPPVPARFSRCTTAPTLTLTYYTFGEVQGTPFLGCQVWVEPRL